MMVRLFVAVWPPDDVVAELRSLPRKDQRGVRFVPEENWHLTLRFLGEQDPDAVIAALDGGRYPPASVHLGAGVDVFADRALVVPASGLEPLAAAVAARTAGFGRPPRKRFAGHLTIARVGRHARMPPALGAYLAVDFDVEAFALVRSRLQPSGARYETLATWPVGGGEAVTGRPAG